MNGFSPESPEPNSPLFSRLVRAPNETLPSEIRRLVADVATDQPVAPDRCRNWTSDHLAIVLSEGIAPWLYRTLRDRPVIGLAAEFLEQLERSHSQAVRLSLANQACFREVVGAFRAEQIPVLVLKGAYLGTFVYRNPALRPMCDVDLLVREEHFEQAKRLLERLGFGIMAEPLEGDFRILQPALAHMRSGIFPCAVDLHRALSSMDYYHLSSSIVWQDAVEGELYGQPVFFLSNELNFIHLGMHTLTHLGLMRNWLDLVLFLRRIDLNWNRLASLAGSLGVLRPVHWVFRDLEQEWGVAAPNRFVDSLAAYVPAPMEDRVVRHKFRYLWRFAARFQLLPRMSSRLRYLRMRLFPAGNTGHGVSGIRGWLTYAASKINYFLEFYRHR